MIRALRGVIQRSIGLSAANHWRGQMLTRMGVRRHCSGSTLLRAGVERSIDYILACFEDYLHYAGASAESLVGQDVVEIGPGDSLGVALCFLAHGAASVTTLDRFEPKTDHEIVRQVHAGVLNRLPAPGRARAAAALQAHRRGEPDGPLRSKRRVSSERAAQSLPPASADLIVSRAVLEHVDDLDAAWASMRHMLRPGGRMWHKVDLRAHGFFETHHPLRFLCFSDAAWRRIASPDPTLNRARRQTYEDLCRGLRTTTYITHILDNDEILPHVPTLVPGQHYSPADLQRVTAIRPKLAPRFAAMSDAELLTTGIFLISVNERG